MEEIDSRLSLSRRSFLIRSGVATGAALSGFARASEETRHRLENKSVSRELPDYGPLIDVNVDLFRWPTRRLRFDESDALTEKLRSHGVEQAWAGTYEGLLHKDLAAVNARLAQVCNRSGEGFFVPFGSVNPAFPDWSDELRRCHEEHKMPGIRLHPNYHGYALDNPEFSKLLSMAAERELVVQLAIQMEDERMMHTHLRVEPVDTTPLSQIVQRTPKLRLILLNALRHLRGEKLTRLIDSGEVHLEIATLEGIGGVGTLLGQVPISRILFGSHAPLFYFESALLKLKETPLTDAQLHSIARANARRLIVKRS